MILAVDDDPNASEALARDLTRRFSPDYRIVVECAAEAALQRLQQLRDERVDVALIIAEFHLRGMSGIELLIEAHRLHPDARRVLMIVFGEAATADNEIARARALGQIDSYVTKPWGSPERWLYAGLTELLSEWAQTHLPQFEVVRLVGPRHSLETHRLRDILGRNPIQYGFYADDSPEGRTLLQEHTLGPDQLPAAIFADGRVMPRASAAEIAEVIGAKTQWPAGLFDVAIVGAGPAGLAAAVYGASEGLRTVVLEAEAVGGQAGTSSMIRNFLGFPRGISGHALATRAFQQATMFGADIVFANRAAGLAVEGSNHVIFSDEGSQVMARAVVIATGATYSRLGVPQVEALTGAGVFYGAGGFETQAMRHRRAFVVGAGNSAGQAAIHLAKHAARVIVLVRGDALATTMSDYLVREIANTPNIEVRLQTHVTGAGGQSYLEALELRNRATGETVVESADGLFVLIGAEPHTEWLPPVIERDEKGYILTGRDLHLPLDCGCEGEATGAWPLQRQPYLLETSVPGVFAAGDVRHRSMKRVASAVGEGSTAIALIHQYLREGPQPRRVSSGAALHVCERHRHLSERAASNG